MSEQRSLTHRQRVLEAVAHREPDRVPIDLGSTRATSIHILGYHKLRAHLGLPERPDTPILDRIYRMARCDEDLLNLLDVDLRGVFANPPDENRVVELGEGKYQDEWGVVRAYPPNSKYYDVVGSPLAGEISLNDILNHPWPDPLDPGRSRGLKEEVARLRALGDHALVLNMSLSIVHTSQFMRGFEDWYTDFVVQPDLICALMDAILDVYLPAAELVLREVGDLVDIVFWGDDLGAQNGPQISPETYRKYLKPRQRRGTDLIRKYSSAPIGYHTCGDVYPLINDLIEVGVNILNPVQVAAKDMDTARLKREFGDRLSFWGANDTQWALPYGEPEDVKQEARHRLRDLAPGGGYLLCAVHNIQPDVRPENILAMYDTAKSDGRYPLRIPELAERERVYLR